MGRFTFPLLLLPILAACGDGDAPEKEIDMDTINERAMGPVVRIEPEPLTFQKLSEHDLLGAGCNFTPDASEEPVFVADQSRAHFLLENRLVGMSPDVGSRELSHGVRTEYDGLTHSAEIWLAMDTEKIQAPEVTHYRGTLEIRDPRGRHAYNATGQWECGA